MISNDNFAIVLTFCRPYADITVHKLYPSSENKIEFWPNAVSTCWFNYLRDSISSNRDCQLRYPWGVPWEKNGHVVLHNDEDDDDGNNNSYCWVIIICAKHFAENFTDIISLNLESDNGKNRQPLLFFKWTTIAWLHLYMFAEFPECLFLFLI